MALLFQSLMRTGGSPFYWVNLELSELPVDLMDVVASTEEASLKAGYLREFTDDCLFADAAYGEVGIQVAELLQALSSISLGTFISDSLGEQASSLDSLLFGFTVAVSSEAAAADSLALRVDLIEEIAQALLASDSLTTASALIATVAVAVALAESVGPGTYAPVDESTAGVDSLTIRIAYYLALAEAVLDTEAITNQTGFVITVLESTPAADTLSGSLALIAALSDGADAIISFRFGDELFRAYVLNGTTGALSEYHNYPFTGIAKLGDTWVGTMESGLYTLTGDTDAGTAIAASLQTGFMDFGSVQLKRIREALLYYRADGALRLKVRAVIEGRVHEYWYQLSSQVADGSREGLIKTGLGIVSRSFAFTLENVAGADFDLTEWMVIPIALLKRRIS